MSDGCKTWQFLDKNVFYCFFVFFFALKHRSPVHISDQTGLCRTCRSPVLQVLQDIFINVGFVFKYFRAGKEVCCVLRRYQSVQASISSHLGACHFIIRYINCSMR